MAREIRPPEWILEELYDTARRWMSARADERATGPVSDWGKGDNFGRGDDADLQDEAASLEGELRDRFEDLVEEFVERVDEL